VKRELSSLAHLRQSDIDLPCNWRTKKGRALYEELFPQLLRRQDEILACLSAQERKQVG